MCQCSQHLLAHELLPFLWLSMSTWGHHTSFTSLTDVSLSKNSELVGLTLGSLQGVCPSPSIFSYTMYIVQNLSCTYLQTGRATCQRWEPFKLLSNVIKYVPWLILWVQTGFCTESKIWDMSQWLNGTGMLNEFGICFVKCGSRHTDGLWSSGAAWNSHYSNDVTCHVELVIILLNYQKSMTRERT